MRRAVSKTHRASASGHSAPPTSRSSARTSGRSKCCPKWASRSTPRSSPRAGGGTAFHAGNSARTASSSRTGTTSSRCRSRSGRWRAFAFPWPAAGSGVCCRVQGRRQIVIGHAGGCAREAAFDLLAQEGGPVARRRWGTHPQLHPPVVPREHCKDQCILAATPLIAQRVQPLESHEQRCTLGRGGSG